MTVLNDVPIIDTYTNKSKELKMDMNTLANQSLEAAMEITGTDGKDEHTQEIAFKLACMAAAENAAN